MEKRLAKGGVIRPALRHAARKPWQRKLSLAAGRLRPPPDYGD
jgi:hypothetical protein